MPQSPTALLLGARKRAALNRWSMANGSTRAGIMIATLAVVAALLLAGHLAADRLLVPPIETMTPTGFEARAKQVAGQTAVELAFWISTFIGAVFSFRVMELLFRRPDIRTVDKLPFPMSALFIDRLVVALLEALTWGVASSIFFIPLAWNGSPWGAIVCVLLLLLSPIATLGIGLGVQLFAGAGEFGGSTSPDGARSVDGYGGAGQMFIFAPGVALAGAAIAVMLLKLGLQEALRLESFNRATATGVTIAMSLSVVSTFLGWRAFKQHYFRMLAGFREADFVGFAATMDYQQSAYEEVHWLERFLPQEARGTFRRHLLQYGRRFALTRYAYPLLWLMLGLALFNFSKEALPIWATALVPMLLLTTLLDPWSRLGTPGIKTMPSQALPVTLQHEAAASQLFAAREVLLFLGPCALLIASVPLIRGQFILDHALAAILVIGAGLAVTAAQGWLGKLFGGHSPARVAITLASVLPTAVIGGASVFGLPIGLGVMAGVLAVMILLTMFQPQPTKTAEV